MHHKGLVSTNWRSGQTTDAELVRPKRSSGHRDLRLPQVHESLRAGHPSGCRLPRDEGVHEGIHVLPPVILSEDHREISF